MPVYCFTSDNGVTIDRHFRMADVPPSLMEGGTVYRRDYLAETKSVQMDADWSNENGGRGREISQLKESLDSPPVYARSPNEARDLALRKGWEADKV